MQQLKLTLAGQQTVDEFLRAVDGVLQRLSKSTGEVDVKSVVNEVVAQVRAEAQTQKDH